MINELNDLLLHNFVILQTIFLDAESAVLDLPFGYRLY